MRIEYVGNGMYRASYLGATAIAPSRSAARDALIKHVVGGMVCT